MLDKSKDQEYCGVRESLIKSAQPQVNGRNLAHLSKFIRDRYDIHLKKDVQNLPAPWTSNEVFKKGKFTNVRREHDRQSKILIDYIAKSNESWFDKFWNIVMFRMYNIGTLWTDIHDTGIVDIKNIPDHLETFRSDFEDCEQRSLPLFTNAFNTGGLKQSLAIPEADFGANRILVCLDNGETVDYLENRDKFKTGEFVSKEFESNMAMRIMRFISHTANNVFPDLHNEVLNAKDQKEAYDLIVEHVRGCSRFLSYQVFVDLTYCDEFPFSENHFTVSGPGCDAGLELLFDNFDGLTKEEALFWLRDNQHIFGIDFNELFSDLEPHDRVINLMSLENCFCEFQKYMRAVEAIERGETPRFKVTTNKLESSVKKPSKGVNTLW